MPRLNARLFPEVYESLGLSTDKMGCIMLDLDPIPVTEFVEWGEEDLFYSPTMKYGQGAVAEQTAHLTLLYGLLEYGSVWKEQVDAVLKGWTPPVVEFENVGHFPGSVEGEDYNVIVGHVRITDAVQEAHDRLSFLPHVDTFPGYKAHVTLAYVKGGDDIRDKWVDALNAEYAGKSFPPRGINYGD